jgi:hypothetical protein
MNAPRHPHPALAAALGAAVAAAALLTAQQATRQPHTVGGYHQSFVIKESGTYAGQGPAPQISLAGHGAQDVCLLTKAGNVTVRGIEGRGGFRGVQANNGLNLRYEQVVMRGSGTPGARDGGTWFFVNGRGIVLNGAAGLDSEGSHALYFSEWGGGSLQEAQVLGCTFRGAPAAPLVQINTASGAPTRHILFQDTTIESTSPRCAALNDLGAGTAADPVRFVRCRFPGPGELVFSNFDAHRPAFATLENCGDIRAPVRIEGGSRLFLKGNTRLLGKVTGKVN